MAVIQRGQRKGYTIQFRYKGVLCRETVGLEHTKANRKHLELMDAAIQRDIQLGKFNYRAYFPDSTTKTACLFADDSPDTQTDIQTALQKYLDGIAKNISKSTLKGYRSALNAHLIPKLGNIKIRDLSVSVLRQFITDINASPKTINNILTPLRGAFEDAYIDGRIDKNPLDRIKNLPVKTEDPDPFTFDEINRILAACTEPQHHNLFKFAFYSGLRTGELIALEWGDIDMTKETARISKNTVLKETKDPKTQSGTREIILLPPAKQALQAQQQHTFLHSHRVFHNPRTNTPWEAEWQLRKLAWQHIIKRAGVRYRKPYQTRHTYASMLLTAGEDPSWIAKQMGHKDWGMIRKVYARWINDNNPTAGQRAAKLISENCDQSVITHSTSKHIAEHND